MPELSNSQRPNDAAAIYNLITAELSPTAKQEAAQSGYVENAVQELSANPRLFRLYKSTFIENNLTPLREKTTQQVEMMRQYVENHAQLEGVRAEKISEFRDFVNQFTPVRSDDDQSLTEFLSPRKLGLDRGDDMYDANVQGGAYVYGSFDALPHGQVSINRAALGEGFDDSALVFDQTRISEQDPKMARTLGIRRLDDSNFDQSAHIVMIDVADILYSADRHKMGRMEAYLRNCFTYKEGKELLAYYLASVFKTPDEARTFISRSGRMFAEKWDIPAETANLIARDELTEMRVAEIQARMLDVFKTLGIMPPAQLEIRIRDRASIKEGW